MSSHHPIYVTLQIWNNTKGQLKSTMNEQAVVGGKILSGSCVMVHQILSRLLKKLCQLYHD